MIYDANDIDRAAIPKADVCIIGAGAAGLAMAHALIPSGKTVIVLEASRHNDKGTVIPDAQHRYEDHDLQPRLYKGFMENEREGVSAEEFFLGSRIKAYGGTTNCWEGWTRPLGDDDFTRWPDGMREALFDPKGDPARQPYQRAMGYCSLPWDYANAYHNPQFWIDKAQETKSDELAVMPGATDRLRTEVVVQMGGFGPGPNDRNWDFQLRWGPEIEKAENVTIYRNANVRRVVQYSGYTYKVEATTVKDGPIKGDDFEVTATSYVLAAGCVENTRLLLGTEAKKHLPVLGQFLMTHPLIEYAARINIEKMAKSVKNFCSGRAIETGEDAPPVVIAMLAPTRELRQEKRIGAFRAWLRFEKEDPDAAHLNLCWEQQPRTDNRISRQAGSEDELFGDELPHGVIALDGDVDDRTRDTAFKEVCKLLVDNGYTTEKQFNIITRTPKLTGQHALGTTRMAESQATGVVDRDCKVFSVSNLFVAGGSVFPTGGWANPTLTIIALALRLADHLMSLPAEPRPT